MNIRFGTKLLWNPQIKDPLLKPDLEKIVTAVNDQFPGDHVVVNVLSEGKKPYPQAPNLEGEFFRLYIQSSGQDPVLSEPLDTASLAIPDMFLAIAGFVGEGVAKLNGKALDLKQFAKSIAQLEEPQ